MRIIRAALIPWLIVSCCAAWAAERGTAEEAKALLQKAVEHYQHVGADKAVQDFTGKKVPWVERDLYVACMNDTT